MARIFTISFIYNEETYNSMVTVRTTPFYIEYTLNNLDVELIPLLPVNKMISPSPKNLIFPNATPEHSTALMNSIIKAVTIHLQAVNY